MVLELLIICVTLYALFNGYIREKVREMELNNDRKEIETENLFLRGIPNEKNI